MQGDPKVIESSNRVCAAELTASNQYGSLSGCESWGLRRWQKPGAGIHRGDGARGTNSRRIAVLDGFPTCRCSIPTGRPEVKEITECDLASEPPAAFTEGATYFHSVKDYVSRRSVRSLMRNEEHPRLPRKPADLIGRIGLELYIQKHFGGLEAKLGRLPIQARSIVVMAGSVPAIQLCLLPRR